MPLALGPDLRVQLVDAAGAVTSQLVMGAVAAAGSAVGVNPVVSGFFGTGATVRAWTASNSVTNTAGDDVGGIGPLTYDTTNSKWNRWRDANSADNSSGTGVAASGVVGWDGSVYRRVATDTSGNTKAVGTIAHDGVDSGAPVKTGFRAIAHGTNPTAVAAADRSDWLGNVAGIPFVIGGHPNVQTLAVQYSTAQTNVAVITVAAGTKIVVTGFMVTAANANIVDVTLRLGFATVTTPAYAAAQLIGTHPGIGPGSGFGRGGGSGIIGVGADDEDLRITTTTTGTIDLMVSYYTIAA